MNYTLGPVLDSPVEFAKWLTHSTSTLVVLFAVSKTGVLEKLGEQTMSVGELADACGLPADKLRRLLNYLAAEGVLTMLPDDHVQGSKRLAFLASIADTLNCHRHYMEAGIPLAEALPTGRPPYEIRFGKPCFEHLGENPELAKMFGGFMVFLTSLVEQFIFSNHEFKPFSVAVDLGGNHGSLLLKLLSYHPQAKGILFDLPEVTEMTAPKVKQAAGGDRVEIVGGSFFESVPVGDLYLLKMILHDWSDEECIKILQNVRKSIVPGGRLAVLDCIVPETPSPNLSNSLDIGMMVWDTGRERKLSEFKTLFDAAGFRFDRVTENPDGQSVIEAVPI